MKKKIRISREFAYLFGIVVLAFAVSLISSTDFGLSTIVAPAYIVSQKVSFLSFGTAEYVVQAVWFVLFCIAMKSFRFKFFFSFATGVIYGAVLDLFRLVVPLLNPEITPPGSYPIWARIICFAVGLLMTGFSVSLLFQTYFYPQVYDFFVKFVSEKYKITRYKFKLAYDLFCLLVSLALSFIFFRKLVGVGIGTFVIAGVNGYIIGFFGKIFDKHFEFYAHFKKLESFFVIE